MSVIPRRSLLFCPGGNARAVAKAFTLPADVVILDLEDAVAPEAKEEARLAVAATLAPSSQQVRAVRVNGLGTVWGEDDLHMVATAPVDAVVLPKVESAQEVKDAFRLLSLLSAAHTPPLWCMIETPLGVLNARKIARCDGVGALIAGTNDLARALHAPSAPGRAALQVALQTTVLAARAHGRAVFDGVYNDYRDEEGLLAECAQGRMLGFDGKTLIHPGQIAAANAAFAPSDAEVAHAREVIAAWNAAPPEARGAVGLNGAMIERLHVEAAEGTVAIHEAIRSRIGSNSA